ncbi:MAG TPA: GNAT family N-acetyltransferase [Croceibacterium sp.]
MFLRTQRLFLRPAWPEDASELARAIGQEQVVRMLARAPWPYHEEHARTWIEATRDPYLPNLLITLPAEDGRIVGCVGLHDESGQIEVGYWIAPTHWGHGYATEALTGLLALARLAGHRRIVSRHAADNPASGKVLRKAGFRPTGRARPFRSLGRDTGRLTAPEYALELADVGPMKRRWTRPEACSSGAIAA